MSNKVIPEHASALSVFDNIKRTKLVFGDGVSLASGELAKELGVAYTILDAMQNDNQRLREIATGKHSDVATRDD